MEDISKDIQEIKNYHAFECFLVSLGITNFNFKFINPIDSMSNSNYLIGNDDGDKLVLRVENLSNSKIINRKLEEENSLLFNHLGISPSLLFIGKYKLSRYLEDINIFDKHSARHCKLLGESLSKLHKSGEAFSNEFNPIGLARSYLTKCKDSDLKYQVANELREINDKYLKHYSTEAYTTCQIDLVPENILVSDDLAYIIDQEYSGMYYAEWDLASVAIECEMDQETEYLFLKGYSGPISSILYDLMKCLSDLVWSAWALYYYESSNNDENMMEYFYKRFNRYRKNYILFNDKWEIK